MAKSERAHPIGLFSWARFYRKGNETGKVSGARKGKVRRPAALGGPPGGRLGRGACARGRGGSRPIRAGVRGGAGRVSSGSASPCFFAHTRIQRAIRPSGILFPFFFSLLHLVCVFKFFVFCFFLTRDLWQCWGEETVAKGNLLFSPRCFFCLSFSFFFLVEV